MGNDRWFHLRFFAMRHHPLPLSKTGKARTGDDSARRLAPLIQTKVNLISCRKQFSLSPASGCKNLIRRKGRDEMIKKGPVIIAIVGASALAVFSMTGPAQAKDAGDWTCSDFLKLSNSAKSRVVYYLVGLNKAQMKQFHDIAAKDFDVPISKVVQHCHSNLPDNLWQAIADHFYWHAQQMP
jgi:hypothetical protein